MSRIVDQKKQQGSVASFIVTGVLLSTVFIGSIVAVKKQFGTNKSGSNDVTKIAKTEDKKVGDNTSTSKSKESTQKESTSKDTGNNNKETESRKKPDSLDNHQSEQKKSETEKQHQELQNQNQQTKLSGASSEALPTTGPIEDIFMMVIGAVAIFGSGYVYYHYGYGRK